MKRIDTREEDGSVDTSNSIRDQLSIDFKGCSLGVKEFVKPGLSSPREP